MNTNLSRRDFLKSSVIAASGLAILPNWLAAQEVPKSKMQISAQMYSVRGDCGANFDNALDKVAKIGFKGVEFAGYYNYGNKPAELKKRLDDLGLIASGTHIGTGSFDKNNLQRTIDFHAAIGCKFLVVPGDGRFTDAALRHVDDALKTHEIVRVLDYTEIGRHVLDLLPVIEVGPADHVVGNGGEDQAVLDQAGLGVGPVEDREVLIGGAFVLPDPSFDVLCDKGGLLIGRGKAAEPDLLKSTHNGSSLLAISKVLSLSSS